VSGYRPTAAEIQFDVALGLNEEQAGKQSAAEIAPVIFSLFQ
jgi:hypothetical protein